MACDLYWMHTRPALRWVSRFHCTFVHCPTQRLMFPSSALSVQMLSKLHPYKSLL